MTSRAILCAGAALVLGGCGGGGSELRDSRVAPGVKGSGETQLLADPAFRSALVAVGVSPQQRPLQQMGVTIGRRLRAIVTDSARLDAGSFSEPYRSFLRGRGRLSVRQFIRHDGRAPVAMATSVGMLMAHLDASLNEAAAPPPTLPAAIVSGFGSRELTTPAAGDRAVAIANALNMLFPAGGHGCADCLASFQLSYANTARTLLRG